MTAVLPRLRTIAGLPHPVDPSPVPPGSAAPPGSPLASGATRRRRRLRTARTLVGISVRRSLLPQGSSNRRRRQQVCGAANLLTALGVRVRVVAPVSPWPRSGRLVVSDHVGWLGDLAVSTAVRGAPVAGPGALAAAGTTRCPVTVRYRVETEAGSVGTDRVPRTVDDVVALDGLVVEVHCLPAG